MVMVPEAVIKRRLTLEDYQALPDDADYEIIEGVLYVAPRARPLHQMVSNRLATRLTVHVEHFGLGFVVPDADLIIDAEGTYISPDIMYFSAERFVGMNRREMIRSVPDLVVEVISPTSADYDRITKRRLYAHLGVPHYWIVDPDRQEMTELVLEGGGTYRERTVTSPESLRPELFPDFAIDVAALFA